MNSKIFPYLEKLNTFAAHIKGLAELARVSRLMRDGRLDKMRSPKENIGVWRSWLAYLHGVQVVVRSSRITPT